jgi:hypothetical protein
VFAWVALVFVFSGFARGASIHNDLGWSLELTPDRGDYIINLSDPAWTIGGSLGKPASDIATAGGADQVGSYRELRFHWREEGRRSGSIRLYNNKPIALFTVTFDDAVTGSPAAFPVLSKLPNNLLAFRYGETDHLRPPTFELTTATDDKDQYGGPFALFDTHGETLICSPAANFMVAMMSGDAQHGGLRSGLNRSLQSVPAGYTHQTILAIDHGINRAFDTWGNALTDLHNKHRPANDADAGLKYLGYWTDNGGSYYYHYDLAAGYAGTLLALKQHFDQVGVPIGYMQIDSWWYPKTFNSVQSKAANKPRSKDPSIPAGTWNRYGGLLEYTAHPDLFPRGLGEFQKQLGVPLITHNRWIDPESPYHQSYKISGIAAVDPAFWDKIIGDIAGWGVGTYEQDWLNYIYLRSPDLFSTTWAGDACMDAMAAACARNGLTMQYCMVLPRDLMQGGAKYSNLTTVRVSGDRLDRGKWREFIYGSRLPASLGVWPWTDAFRSKETANLLIATLSAGMVGINDKIGDEDVANIFQSVRKDGVIVKPDAPLTPVDATFIAEAQGDHATPLVCATHTAHGDANAVYVFAFEPKAPAKEKEPKAFAFDLRSSSLSGQTYAYDYFSGTGRLIQGGELSEKLGADGWSYWVLAPVGPSRMALIGDTGKFITRGKQRITAIQDTPAGLNASLAFAPKEEVVTVAVYAPAEPSVHVTNGTCRKLTYDSATKIARAEITPAGDARGSVVDVHFVLP